MLRWLLANFLRYYKLVNRSPELFGLPFVLILCAAATSLVPFIFLGNPSGHDFEFHVNSWMEVVAQWKQGVIHPAWAGMAHYGFGEPRFIFYPPISWTLGAILGALLPWVAVPAAYILIAIALSGCSMFLLARAFLSRNEAIFAAVFYTTNPYYLVEIYWRSAFAELLAGACLPLIVLLLWRLNEAPTFRNVTKLAFVIAAVWLTNIPAAVMATYSVALLVLVLAARGHSLTIVFKSFLSGIIGLGLTASYLLPAFYEREWVNIPQLFAPGVQPADNFLFTIIQDVDHNRFNLLVSLLAFSEIIALAGAILLSLRFSLKQNFRSFQLPTIALWGLWSSVLMFSFTVMAWKVFPKLKFVQLPWRWLLCLNVALALLAAAAWRRWPSRILVSLTLLGMVGFVGSRVQPPWWDASLDIVKMQNAQRNGAGYEGTDEYVPTEADPDNAPRDAPLVSAKDGSPVEIHIVRWTAQDKAFTAKTSLPAKLELHLFNYPLWKVEINGRVTPTETEDETGQMVIPIQPGANFVRIRFKAAWDKKAGIIISLATLILTIFLSFRRN